MDYKSNRAKKKSVSKTLFQIHKQKENVAKKAKNLVFMKPWNH